MSCMLFCDAQLAHKFVDLATLNFADSAKLIHEDRVDILLDMQLHTLGHRLQITAHTPAAVQVSVIFLDTDCNAIHHTSISRVAYGAQHIHDTHDQSYAFPCDK